MEEKALILTFNSVNFTMQAEKALLEKGFEIKTIPTPREISNSCGLSIKTSLDNLDGIMELKKSGLSILHFWKYTKEDGNKKAEMID